MSLAPPTTDEVRGPAEAESVTSAFAEALNGAEPDRAAALFADDGCFVTPDATAVYGPRAITGVLVQLTACGVQLRISSRSTRVTRGLALCKERWIFTYVREGAASFIQSTDCVVLLCRLNRTWRISVAAPWGVSESDRRSLASMRWP